MKSTDLSPTLKQVISETFSELPYKVLWKFDEEELVKKSDNVKIVKWIPQQDVLSINFYISNCIMHGGIIFIHPWYNVFTKSY